MAGCTAGASSGFWGVGCDTLTGAFVVMAAALFLISLAFLALRPHRTVVVQGVVRRPAWSATTGQGPCTLDEGKISCAATNAVFKVEVAQGGAQQTFCPGCGTAVDGGYG